MPAKYLADETRQFVVVMFDYPVAVHDGSILDVDLGRIYGQFPSLDIPEAVEVVITRDGAAVAGMWSTRNNRFFILDSESVVLLMSSSSSLRIATLCGYQVFTDPNMFSEDEKLDMIARLNDTLSQPLGMKSTKTQTLGLV